MDTKLIEYILKIAEENNITRAAQKLHLTQPALNQQLLRLERELGLQLFYRSRTDWHPTKAGEIYLENARKMLLLKQETYYPEITVEPSELSVRRQQTLIARGQLDLGFQTLCDVHRTDDEYIPLATEEIYLAIPKGHPVCKSLPAVQPKGKGKKPLDFPELDICKLQYEPFVLMYKESTIRQLTDRVFANANFSPNVLFETASNQTILMMIRSFLCCGLIPAYYLQEPDEKIACFSLPEHPCWDIAASYRKGTYLSKPAKYFIQLASAYWNP